MHQYLRTLISLGTDADRFKNLPDPKARLLFATNVIGFVFGILALIYIFVFFWLELFDLSLLCTILAVINFSWTALNRRGHYNFSRLGLITAANGSTFFFAGVLGPNSGVHFLYLALAGLPALLFERTEKFKIFYGIGLCIGLFTILEVSDYSSFHRAMLSPSQQRVFYFTFMPTALLLWLATVFYQFFVNEKVQDSLVKAGENTRTILESISDAFYAFDSQWRFTYINKMAHENLGKPMEELIGKNVWEIFPEAIGSKFYKDYMHAFETQQTVEFIEFYPPFNRWYETHVYPSKEGITVYFRNITERKKAEEAIRESNDRFRQIAENISEVFWMGDISKQTIIYISPGYEKIWGRSRQSLYDNPLSFSEAIHPEDRARVLKAMPLQAQGKYDEEYRISTPDGTERWIHDRAFPIRDEQGNVYRVCGIAEDITPRKHAEFVIEQQKLKIISSAKFSAVGEMAGGIAHEINNPLAIIHGRAGLLRELAKQGTLDLNAVAASAEKIENTAMRISKIVQALRTLGRDGTQDPFEIVPVARLIEDTIELCRERFKFHNIDLRVVPFSDELRLECRSVQICQVLLNLLNNAHDAVVNLPEKWIQLSVRDGVRHLEIRITDSGSGVPAELQEKIMNPFFTTKEIGNGTGLGLSISKSIVKAHSGHLALDAHSPNTCFVVTLPKSQAAGLS